MQRADVLNRLLLPLRLACSHETLNRMGLRSLRDERYALAMRYARGRLLDIGCGHDSRIDLAAKWFAEEVVAAPARPERKQP